MPTWPIAISANSVAGSDNFVYLAQVLAGDPQILLLDEATSASHAQQLEVLDLVRTFTRRRGLTTHRGDPRISTPPPVSQIVPCLKDGEVHVAGTPSEAITARMLAEVFGSRQSLSPIRSLADRHSHSAAVEYGQSRVTAAVQCGPRSGSAHPAGVCCWVSGRCCSRASLVRRRHRSGPPDR